MSREENVKNENYVNIQGWMLNELGLKGNELIIYAIIYGFSQKKGQYFNGGFQYLADWTNSSRQTVINIMKALEEKRYIVKVETGNSSGKSNVYYAVREVVKKDDQSKNLTSQENRLELVKKFDGGSQKTLHHNIYILNNNILEREEGQTEEKEKLKETLNEGMYYQEIKMLLSDYNINYKNIARCGKSIERIKAVIKFAKENNKGEGWIVGAIKDDYKLEIYSKSVKNIEDIGKKQHERNEDNEKLYKMLGI